MNDIRFPLESLHADALCADMATLVLDENQRKALAAEGRAYALTKTWDSVFSELVEHYCFTIYNRTSNN